MDISDNISRKNIPKWRSIIDTPDTELSSGLKFDITDSDVKLKLQRFYYDNWSKEPTLKNAMSVLDISVFLKNQTLAIGPAEQLINSSETMHTTKEVAKFILGISTSVENINDNVDSLSYAKKTIKKNKELLNRNPRNSIIWAELARNYTITGNLEKAKKCILSAINLSSENRFILRSMARFMVHIREPDHALYYLRKSRAIKHDPWIQSTEISISDLINKPTSVAGAYIRNISREDFHAIHKSELLSSIATIELKNGKSKNSKKLFRESLIAPTENSLSQALWINSENNMGLEIKNRFLHIDRAFEAHYYSYIKNEKWTQAIDSCRQWLHDERFSIRAAIDGSYLASAVMFNHEEGIRFCDIGLIANANNKLLLNNKAACLAKIGSTDDARKIVDHNFSNTKDESYYLSLATKGLIDFRSGNLDRGRANYLDSINGFLKLKKPDNALKAKISWFYEESKTGSLTERDHEKIIDTINSDLQIIHLQPLSLQHVKIIIERIRDTNNNNLSIRSNTLINNDFKSEALYLPINQ